MKKNSIGILVLSIVFVVSSAFTATPKPKKLFDCTGKIQKAIDKYNKKKYLDCQDLLTEVLAQCPGHSAYDTALYYQGKSMLATKKFEEAKTEFDRLVTTFPTSAFYEEALFRIGQCMYLASYGPDLDQAQTKDAESRLKDFMELYSKGQYADSAAVILTLAEDKLAEKELNSAKFYEKIDQWEAAIVYYRLLMQDFPQSKFIPEAMVNTAEDLIKANRTSEAAAILNDIASRTNDDVLLKKANALKAKIPK